MTTANDILTSASRRIGILASEEALTAAEAVDSLAILNQLMFGFGPKGIEYVHVTLALTDTVNLPDEQIGNLIYMLCDELALEFQITLGSVLVERINAAKLELQAAFLVVNPAVPDKALRYRRMGWYDFNRGE